MRETCTKFSKNLPATLVGGLDFFTWGWIHKQNVHTCVGSNKENMGMGGFSYYKCIGSFASSPGVVKRHISWGLI